MTSNTENTAGTMDTVKLSLAALAITGGVVFFYLQAEGSLLLRVLVLLGTVVVAVVLGLGTGKGREIAGFFRESQNEVRRVVWPSRQESIQTTLIVFITVIIAALMLWLFDSFLGWAVRWLTGMGG